MTTVCQFRDSGCFLPKSTCLLLLLPGTNFRPRTIHNQIGGIPRAFNLHNKNAAVIIFRHLWWGKTWPFRSQSHLIVSCLRFMLGDFNGLGFGLMDRFGSRLNDWFFCPKKIFKKKNNSLCYTTADTTRSDICYKRSTYNKCHGPTWSFPNSLPGKVGLPSWENGWIAKCKET